ncbi:MAG: Conserved putative rane protein [Chlamydiales bacterium]|jgi:hypothetical protein|nr:Conserved putative rane protein [Chlamydiales bacterium]
MNLQKLVFIFNRALKNCFNKEKYFLTCACLLVCGTIVAFCRGFAIAAGPWAEVGLSFLPFFICGCIWAPIGILLIRLYHDSVKNKETTITDTLIRSWQVMLNSSYLFLPLIIIHCMLWIILGLFFFIKSIPFIGEGISILLASGPFILILLMIVLSLVPLLALFFVVPVLALKEKEIPKVLELVWSRVIKDPSTQFFLFFIGCTPLLLIVLLLLITSLVSGATYLTSEGVLSVTFQWFCSMFPFVVLLAPTIIFFFNFAAESHVITNKEHGST